MRKLVGITALFAGLAILFGAGAMPASADPGDPNGANGTVKIHDWPEHKNGSDMANDPKVCQFEIHGFKFDRGQTGRWWIQDHNWGNGDPGKSVLAGTYGPADANGDWTSGPYKLADGHYKLFVEMTHKAGNSGNTVTTYKHKVFKVECPTSSAPGGSNTNSNTSNNSNNTTGTVSGNAAGNATGSSAGTPANAVAGFESAAVTGQIGLIVELAQPAGVAGSESAPEITGTAAAEAALAAIASLPATSTGTAGLGVIGLAMTALGIAMLKRQGRS